MSNFNALGARGGISRALELLTDQQAGGAVTTLAPELQPIVDPWRRPENWALLGGTLGMGFAAVAAGGAGTRSIAQLHNPTDSGVLGILESVWITNASGAVQGYALHWITAALTTSTGGWSNRDTRRATTTGLSGSLGMRIRTQNNAALASNAQLSNIALLNFTTIIIPLDIVIQPGRGFAVCPETDNVVLSCTFVGRELSLSRKLLSNL